MHTDFSARIHSSTRFFHRRASVACWTACTVPIGCCIDRAAGFSGTITSSNSSCEMALMVYVSVAIRENRSNT